MKFLAFFFWGGVQLVVQIVMSVVRLRCLDYNLVVGFTFNAKL